MSNKFFFICTCIFLTSCVNHEYQEFYKSAKINLVGTEDIPIDQDFISNRSYSFIKVRVGKSVIAIMPLLSVDNDEFEWVGSNGDRIITKFGRVIGTYGLEHNSSIIERGKILSYENIDNSSFLTRLEDPSAIFELSTSYSRDISSIYLDKLYSAYKLREDFSSNSSFRWEGVNYFWFDVNSGLPLKTHHHTHPFLPSLNIEFYYKF